MEGERQATCRQRKRAVSAKAEGVEDAGGLWAAPQFTWYIVYLWIQQLLSPVLAEITAACETSASSPPPLRRPTSPSASPCPRAWSASSASSGAPWARGSAHAPEVQVKELICHHTDGELAGGDTHAMVRCDHLLRAASSEQQRLGRILARKGFLQLAM